MELSEQDITDVSLGAAEVNAVSGAISFFRFHENERSFYRNDAEKTCKMMCAAGIQMEP